MKTKVEARFPGKPGAGFRGRLFDREASADAVFNALAAVLGQIDYTDQACRPNEMVGAVLDRHLIEQAKTALDAFTRARSVHAPRIIIPE